MPADPPQRICSTCKSPIPEDSAAGECPNCLLGLFFENDSEDEVEGETFGDYVLERVIARGGMGVVYKARQKSLNRTVALKMIVGGELATDEAVRRFEVEAESTANLQHPNIVSIYHVGKIDGQPYLAMKFVDGKNLADSMADFRLSENTGKTEEGSEDQQRTIASFLAKVVRAIAYTHQRGILHRDIKPSNILIDQSGEPLLADFGLAKLLHTDQSALTLSSSALGSPHYMAPEQAVGESTVASDVWGVGAVLYEMLTGEPPFQGKTVLATVRKVIDDSVVSPTRKNAVVRQDLETICLRCLQKKPADRYASARELADDLERFARGESVAARPLSGVGQFWRWCLRKPALAGMGAALALALLVGFGVSLWQWSRAVAANAGLAESVSRFEWKEIGYLIEQDQASSALAILALHLRRNPDDWRAAMYGLSILEERNFAVPAGIPFGAESTREVFDIGWDQRGTFMAGHRKGKEVLIWEAKESGSLRAIALPAEVAALKVSPDGNLLAVGVGDGQLYFLDPVAGSEIIPPLPIGDNVTAVEFGQRGAVVAVSNGRRVSFFSSATGEQTRPAIEVEAAVDNLVVSGDGNKLAFSFGKSIAVADFSSAGEINSFVQGAIPRRIQLSHDGSKVASLVAKVIRVWDTESKELVGALESQDSDRWTSMAIQADGERIIIGTQIGKLQLWDLRDDELREQQHRHRFAIRSVTYDQSGDALVSASFDATARIWNSDGSEALCEPIADSISLTRADFFGEGEQVITSGADMLKSRHSYRLWSTPERERRRVFVETGFKRIEGLNLSRDGKKAAFSMPGEGLSVFDVQSRALMFPPLPVEDANGVLFSADSERLFLIDKKSAITEWSVSGGAKIGDDFELGFRVSASAVSRDGNTLALCGTDGTILSWDTRSAEIIWKGQHDGFAAHVEFSPDGRSLLTTSSDATVAVWDLASGERKVTFDKHSDKVLHATWAPDSGTIISGSYDNTARIWNSRTGEEIAPPLQLQNELTGVAYSPDGTSVATCSRDGIARLWIAATGKPLGQPMREKFAMRRVLFSPDGDQLITVCQGGLRHWDAKTAEPLTVLRAFPFMDGIGYIGETTASLSPDGWRLLTGVNGSQGILWDLRPAPEHPPKWLADFFEGIAMQRVYEDGTVDALDFEDFEKMKEEISGDDFYARKAKHYTRSW